MANMLQILGWKVSGLRCPDHALTFEKVDGNVHAVSLIQMPNGTGKTTTLQLLRAALSGRAWEADEVRELRKRGATSERGVFKLRLKCDGRLLTITINFDFVDDIASFRTTYGAGQKIGFHPPRALERFLRPHFVDFFVFDGELAARLLDRQCTNAESAIEDLFQLTLFSRVKKRVEDYWLAYTKGRTATEEKGFARRKNRVQLLESRIKEVRREKAAMEEKRAQTKTRLDARKEQFHETLKKQGKLNEELHRVNSELKNAERECLEASWRTLVRFREPHRVSTIAARDMIVFKGSLDRLKLPESTAREFFEELAEETHCVCGRPLDETTRAHICEQSKKYLGSDDVALLNAIKGDVAQLIGDDSEGGAAELRADLASLREAVGQRRNFRNDLERIEAEGAEHDPEAKNAKNEIDALEQELGELDRGLEKFRDRTGRDDEIFDLNELNRRLDAAKKDLDEVRDTLSLGKKRDILVEILGTAQEEARRNLCAAICDQTNARISELMPHNGIRIADISKCLRLVGQEGGSVGETLSVGYAFLATLFNRSGEHVLPFVVDSPAGPIDLEIRPRIAELIPSLTGQFVAFVISSERQGFAPALAERANADGGVQFLTLFRKETGAAEERAREFQFEETEDSICVAGVEYFNEFQLDEEAVTNGIL